MPPIGAAPSQVSSGVDWNALINQDPGRQQAFALANAQGSADVANRNAQFRQVLIPFGDTSLTSVNTLAGQLGLRASDLSGVLDKSTLAGIAQANASGVGTLARLSAANDKANLNTVNALNARGMLNSGETAYQSQQNAQAYQNSQYDARSQLLQALQTYQSNYLAAKQQLAEAEMAAIQAAADRQFQYHSVQQQKDQQDQNIDPTTGLPWANLVPVQSGYRGGTQNIVGYRAPGSRLVMS